MKKLLFICRKYNDLDHSSPLMDYLLNSNEFKIDLLNINLNLNLYDDFKIKYLKKKYKFKFQEIHLDRFYINNWFNTLLIKLITVKKNSSISIFFLLKIILFKTNFKNYLINKLATSNIDVSYPYDAIIFDHMDMKKLPILKNIILNYKKIYNSKLISIPHGFSTNSKSKGIEGIKIVYKNLVNFCDLVFFNNKYWYRELLNFGIKKNKSRNYGSIRFTKYWSNTLINNLDNLSQFKTKKIKVLILGFEKARIKIKNFNKLYQDTLDFISKIDDFEIIFKPPTRTNTAKFVKLPENFKVSFDHTVSLIKNSDIVIGHNSGVVFEVFLQNKKYISLRYLRPEGKEYDNVFEKFNVCFSPKNFDKFKDKILKYNSFKFINIKNRDKFIKNFLNHNSNPLNDYFKEINQLVNVKN